MKTNGKVSVIMNCFNCEKYLKEAIESVYSQTYKNWEIIFWDNASTDKSAEIAKHYDDKLKYVRGENNVKLYQARNFAISKATGEYIAFLDSDDMWLPNKLERQVAIFRKCPEIKLVFSNYFSLNEFDQTKKVFFEKTASGYSSFEENLYNYKVGILTAIVRNAVISNLGQVFDGKLSYSGDYDCFMRILSKNLSYYIDEPLAVRRCHDEAYSAITPRIENMDEILYVLDEFLDSIPEVKTMYAEAFRHMKRKIVYKKAYAYFMEGNAAEIRKQVSEYKYCNLSFLALYLFFCVPYSLYLLFKKIYKKPKN